MIFGLLGLTLVYFEDIKRHNSYVFFIMGLLLLVVQSDILFIAYFVAALFYNNEALHKLSLFWKRDVLGEEVETPIVHTAPLRTQTETTKIRHNKNLRRHY